jgi:hypothetical protein
LFGFFRAALSHLIFDDLKKFFSDTLFTNFVHGAFPSKTGRITAATAPYPVQAEV